MKKQIKNLLILTLTGLLFTTINSCEEDELLLIKEVVITWENPGELVEGLPLTDEQLSATANVPGTFVFTPPVGTVLPKGDNQVLKADFTPTDSKYPSLSKTVTINIVDKYVPEIDWENPTVLALGTPLSEEQLNATANVPGTFVYTPPIGTILPLGENQELRVDFTPSVPTHQATSKTVYINVRDVVPLKLVENSPVYFDGQSIAINVSDNVGNLGSGPETGFTVHITNEVKSVDRDVTITGVAVDAVDATKIIFTLNEAIYGDDKITIKFNEEGNTIVSADDQPLKSFETQIVTIPVTGEDLLADKSDWAGFEATDVPSTGGVAGYWVGGDGLPWQRTTELAASGEASMKYSGGFDVKPLYGMNFGDNVDMEIGVYEVSHKIYIENGSGLKALRTALARKANGWVDDLSVTWNVENIARGEWVTIKQNIYFPVAVNNSDKMRYTYYVESNINPEVTGDQTFYLDDMGVRKVDLPARP